MSALQSQQHHCVSFRDGDWIIYLCSSCAYEYRENWRSKETRVRNDTLEVDHFGGYYPEEYREVFENRN